MNKPDPTDETLSFCLILLVLGLLINFVLTPLLRHWLHP